MSHSLDQESAVASDLERSEVMAEPQEPRSESPEETEVVEDPDDKPATTPQAEPGKYRVHSYL